MKGKIILKDILPFTILQEGIQWDNNDRQFYLNFKDDEYDEKYINDILAEQLSELPIKELALLAETAKNEEEVKLKLFAFLKLEEIARNCGVYDEGIFGASFINVVNNPEDYDGYGKSEKHLELGSLNVPTQKLGCDSIWSPTQYFYFSRGRSSHEESLREPAQHIREKPIFPSEVFHILEAKNLPHSFLNKYEEHSSSLFVRYEYILLYLMKNYDFLEKETDNQLYKLAIDILRECPELIRKITCELNSEDNLSIVIKKAINDNKITEDDLSPFKNRAGAVLVELRELILEDPQRLKWLNGIIGDSNILERIHEALETDQDLEESSPLKRLWIKNAKDFFDFDSNGKIKRAKREALQNLLPPLDLPHQAYLRLLAPPTPTDGKKKRIELAHIVVPVNHWVNRNEDPRSKYFKTTMYMLVAAKWEDLFAKLKNGKKTESDIIHDITNCLGLFISAALELLTIPEAIRLNETTRLHSIKSAITAIMSRNGSHNLGSHVINRVVEEMDDLNIQDHKFFLRYLQQRLDFLAQLSTEFYSWESSHWFANEIMKFFYEQHHLLDFIARAEGFVAFENNPDNNGSPHSSYKLLGNPRVNFPTGDNGVKEPATLITIVLRRDTTGAEIKKVVIPGGEGDLQHDVLVAVPNGLVGFHAIYTIMENFIRNAAKHGYATRPDRHKIQPKIYIKLGESEKDPSYYPISVWDNFSHLSHPADCTNLEDNDKQWLVKNDFKLAHYNYLWHDDITDWAGFCRGLVQPREESDPFKDFFDGLSQKLSFLREMLKSMDNEHFQRLRNDPIFTKRFTGRIIDYVNKFLRFYGDEDSQQASSFSEQIQKTQDGELKALATEGNRTLYQRVRFNRLILEKGIPNTIKPAPRIRIEASSPKPAGWCDDLFDYVQGLVADIPNERGLTFRVDYCPINKDFENGKGLRSLRFIHPESWADLLQINPSEQGGNDSGNGSRQIPPAELESFLERYYSPVHWRINREVWKSFIDERGQLRRESWGIAEMKISAGYLRQAGLREIGGEGEANYNILKAVAHPWQENGASRYRLAYEFHLKRPREVAFSWAKAQHDKLDRLQINLSPYGIEFHPHEAFRPTGEDSGIERTIPSSEFFVFLTGYDLWTRQWEAEERQNTLLALLARVADSIQIDSEGEITRIDSQAREDLKIEIEKYPMRLFVIYWAEEWETRAEKLEKDPFIGKRICFLADNYMSSDNFWKKFTDSPQMLTDDEVFTFKMLLYQSWLKHLKEKMHSHLERGALKLYVRTKPYPSLDQIEGLKGPEQPRKFQHIWQTAKQLVAITLNQHSDKMNQDQLAEFITRFQDCLADQFIKLLSKTMGMGMENYLPPTLPNEYRESGGKKASQFYNDILDCSWQEDKAPHRFDEEDKLRIRYRRHKPGSEETNAVANNDLYDEILSGAAMHFPVLAHCRPETVNALACQLAENALLRIGIADERILASPLLLEKSSRYKSAGLFFVSNFCGVKIETQSPHGLILADNGQCQYAASNKPQQLDILIVHQGILDKGKERGLFGGRTDQLISKIKENIPWVIVTSGRGHPAFLPQGAKFIAFSHVEATLLASFHSKFTLTRLIASLKGKRSR